MAKKNEKEQVEQEQMAQNFSEQINYLQNLVNQMQQNMEDLDKLKSDLAEAGKIPPGSEIIAPIANGIFIKATLKDSRKLLINVGRGVVVEKTIPETIRLLEKQEKEIGEAKTSTIEKLEQLYAMMFKQTISR